MTNENRSRNELGAELARLRDRVAELEGKLAGERQADRPDTAEPGLFRTLADSAPVGICLVQDSKFVYANQALADLIGLPLGELLSKRFQDIIHPDHQVLVGKHGFAKLARKATPESCELRLLVPSGEANWSQFSGTTIEYQGRPAILGVVLDVTEQKTACEKIAASEEEYRNLFENSQVGMFRSLVDGQKMLAVNRQLADTWGYTVDEIMKGAPLERWYNPELRGRWIQLLRRDGTVKNFEAAFRTKNDELRHVLISAQLYPDDDYIDGTVVDITELKKTEEALRENEEIFRALAEAAPIGIAILQDDKMVFASQETQRVFGRNSEDIGEVPFWSFFHPDDQDLVRKHGLARQQGGYVPESYEVRLINPSGETRWILLMGRQIAYKGSPASLAIGVDISKRKRMETALKASEKKYRDLFENAQVAMYRTTMDGSRCLAANKKMAEILGYTIEELLTGSPRLGWFNPAERDELIQTLSSVGHIEDLELQILTKSGEVRDVRASAQIHPEQGCLEGTFIDITEHRKADEALKVSQSNLTAIVENTEDLILLCDKEGNVVYFNTALADAVRDILGEDLRPGIKAYPLVADEKARAFWVGCHRRVLSGERFDMEYAQEIENKANRYFKASFYPIIEGGVVTGFCQFTHDITERRRAEERLRESEERFRRITERCYDVILIADTDGVLTYVSPSAEKVIGYRPEDMLGKNVSEFVDEYQLSEAAVGIAEMAQGRSVEGMQLVMTGPSGKKVDVEANSSPVIKDGRIIGSQAIVRDFSERKRAKKMLEQAFEDQSRQLRQVAGGLAHDIYNDLYPLTASLHKLRQRLAGSADPNSDRNLRLLDVMDNAVRRSINLTESVNLYSKLDRVPVAGSSGLADVIDDILKQNRGRLKEMAVSVDVRVPRTVRLACPESQVFYLFNNLLLNSLDALVGSDSRRIKIATSREGALFRIEFSDTGAGVPEEVLPKVLDPFFSTKAAGGSGLGLAIVKRIVDLYGGRIDIKSSLDTGTTCVIILPGNVGTRK